MDERPDVIRQQIEETRESLTDKLETLEGQVKDTVSTVSDTLESVKETVEGTVEREITEDTQASGRTVRASEDDPQYEVRSDKSGRTAVHKPDALHED